MDGVAYCHSSEFSEEVKGSLVGGGGAYNGERAGIYELKYVLQWSGFQESQS